MIKKEIIIIFLIIITLSLCCCFDDDDNNGKKPTLKIDSVDLRLYESQSGYIGEDDLEFNYEISYNHFPEKGVEIKWIIKLMGNETTYHTTEFNTSIREYRGSGKGIYYLTFEDIIPTPDKYRVEVYFEDKLMDSMKKNIVIEP